MLFPHVRLIATSSVTAYWRKHPQTEASLRRWVASIKAGAWTTPTEIQSAFSKARVLNGERVRFEVSGGDYRLIAAFDFERGLVFVKFIGTHAEYDKIDALTVAQF